MGCRWPRRRRRRSSVDAERSTVSIRDGARQRGRARHRRPPAGHRPDRRRLRADRQRHAADRSNSSTSSNCRSTSIMVLDTSGSVAGRAAARAESRRHHHHRAPAAARPRRAGLVLAPPRPACGADRRHRGTLRRSVEALDAQGSTALRDAAFAALALRTAEATRTLVLLFSDGLDTASILSEDRVHRDRPPIRRDRLRDRHPRAACAARPGSGIRSDAPTDHRFLERLSRETAGRLLYAEQNRDIERTFARVLDEFNTPLRARLRAARRRRQRLAPARRAAEEEKRYGAGAAGLLRGVDA